MTRHVLGDPSEFPEGTGVGVEVDGLPIAVYRVDGEFYALSNRCPHKGGPMFEGTVDAEACSVQCPWHGWEWDLASGRFVVDERQRLRTFDVGVEGGSVVLDL